MNATFWSGEQLKEVIVILPLGEPPMPIALFDGFTFSLLDPSDLVAFFRIHIHNKLVCRDCSALWQILVNIPACDQLARQLIEENRVIDLALLEALVRVANESSEQRELNLDAILQSYAGADVTTAGVLHDIQVLIRRSDGTSQDAFVTQLTALLSMMLTAYRTLIERHRSESSNDPSYGPLGIGIHVRGCVAIGEQQLLSYRQDRLDDVQTQWNQEFRERATILSRDSEWQEHFPGRSALVRSSDKPALGLEPRKLDHYLRTRLENVVDRWFVPFPILETAQGHASLLPGDWEVPSLFDCGIYLLRRLLVLQQLLRLTNQREFHFNASQLPRLAAAPSNALVTELLERQLLTDRGTRPKFLVRFPELDLRALGQCYEDHQGTSNLAQMFRSGQSLQTWTVQIIRERLGIVDDPARHVDANDIASRYLAAANYGIHSSLVAKSLSKGVPRQEREVLEALISHLDHTTQESFSELHWQSEALTDFLAANLAVEPVRVRSLIADTNLRRFGRAIGNVKADSSALESFACLNIAAAAKKGLFTKEGRQYWPQMLAGNFEDPRRRVRSAVRPLWYTAPHLDLADNALKLAAYALVANGIKMLAATDRVFLVCAAESCDLEEDCIREIAQQGASALIPRAAVVASVERYE